MKNFQEKAKKISRNSVKPLTFIDFTFQKQVKLHMSLNFILLIMTI